MSILIVNVIFLTSIWSITIFHQNILLFICLWILTNLIFLIQKNSKLILIFIVFLAIVSYIQISTTIKQPIGGYSQTEKLSQQQNLDAYTFVRAGYWLEQKPITLSLRKVTGRLMENFEINKYFFGGHPRAQVGENDFEKFSFVLLPFFLVGLYQIIKDKNRFIFMTFIMALIISAIWGNMNDLGNYLLLPCLVVIIFFGLKKCFHK